MNGDRITSRITSEERSTLSSYIGLGIAVVLAAGAIYLFLLSHEEKKKVLGSFEDLKGELGKQQELRDQIFAQEMSSMKDRERLLEEKFKEALKRADTDSDKPFRNPLDLD